MVRPTLSIAIGLSLANIIYAIPCSPTYTTYQDVAYDGPNTQVGEIAGTDPSVDDCAESCALFAGSGGPCNSYAYFGSDGNHVCRLYNSVYPLDSSSFVPLAGVDVYAQNNCGLSAPDPPGASSSSSSVIPSATESSESVTSSASSTVSDSSTVSSASATSSCLPTYTEYPQTSYSGPFNQLSQIYPSPNVAACQNDCDNTPTCK